MLQMLLFYDLGDFSGQVGGHIDGFERAYGQYDVGQRNFEGRLTIEYSL